MRCNIDSGALPGSASIQTVACTPANELDFEMFNSRLLGKFKEQKCRDQQRRAITVEHSA